MHIVQITGRCCQCWSKYMSLYGVTGVQWVKLNLPKFRMCRTICSADYWLSCSAVTFRSFQLKWMIGANDIFARSSFGNCSFRVCGSRENINVIYRAASAQRYVLMSPGSPPYTFLYASARCKQPRGESSPSGRLTVVTSMWHRTARANLFFNGWFIPNCKYTGHRCGWWMVSLRFIGYSWIRTYPATHEVIRSKLG